VLVKGEEVREVRRLSEVLATPEAELKVWRLVQDDIRCQFEEPGGTPEGVDLNWVEERLDTANESWDAFNLTKDGLVISYSHYAFGYSVLDVTIPYEKLVGLLRPTLLPKRPNYPLQPTTTRHSN
jgi:hypothetical protein